jgi:phosphopantetheine adenylyltransferase
MQQMKISNIICMYGMILLFSSPYIDHDNIQSILVRDIHRDGQHIDPYIPCKVSGTFINFLINGS